MRFDYKIKTYRNLYDLITVKKVAVPKYSLVPQSFVLDSSNFPLDHEVIWYLRIRQNFFLFLVLPYTYTNKWLWRKRLLYELSTFNRHSSRSTVVEVRVGWVPKILEGLLIPSEVYSPIFKTIIRFKLLRKLLQLILGL